MESHLSGSHQKIYDRLFQHPLPHNLHWREVWSMFLAMADVDAAEEKDGSQLKLSRGGETLVLHKPRDKDLGDEDLIKIRHFLDRSRAAAAPVAPAGTHLLVVIDHREARIFEAEMHGAVAHKITPYDPFGFGRALHDKGEGASGERRPEQKSFYEAVAKTLQGAKQILMFGTGTGASSAMEELVRDLKKRHHDIAARIIGSVAVDEKHLTDDQLLAKAREMFGSAEPAALAAT